MAYQEVCNLRSIRQYRAEYSFSHLQFRFIPDFSKQKLILKGNNSLCYLLNQRIHRFSIYFTNVWPSVLLSIFSRIAPISSFWVCIFCFTNFIISDSFLPCALVTSDFSVSLESFNWSGYRLLIICNFPKIYS